MVREMNKKICLQNSFVKIPFEYILDDHVGYFVSHQGTPAGCFQAIITILFTQAKNAKTGVIGLFDKDFLFQYLADRTCRIVTDLSSFFDKLFAVVALDPGVMILIRWHVFG